MSSSSWQQSRSVQWLLLMLFACLCIIPTANANANANTSVRSRQTTKLRGESELFPSDNNLNNYFNRRRFLQKDDKKDEKDDKNNNDNKDDKEEDKEPEKEPAEDNNANIPAIKVTSSPTKSPTKAPTTPPPTRLPTPPPTPPPTRLVTPPPTPLPTTPRPTPPTGPLPLQWSVVFPLQRCEGDCDVDMDCMGTLVCYQRDGGEAVPRCIGEDESRIDYCVEAWELPPPSTPSPTHIPTQPPTPFPTTAPPTVAPNAPPSPPPTPFPTTAPPTEDYTEPPTPGYIGCQKAAAGEVYTTNYSITIGYYYEVITKRTEPLLDLSQNIDAMFQKYLATSLVDCDLAEASDVQGVSPAGVDNLAGSCVSKTMLSRLGNNEDMICYQMQGSVEVYLSEYYYVALSAASSGSSSSTDVVKDKVWDILRDEINNSRRRQRRQLLVDFSQGIYGLFFLSGTDPNDGIVNVLGAGVAGGDDEDSSGTSAGEAVGIVFACLIIGLLLFVGFRKYQASQDDDSVDYELKDGSAATERDDRDSPVRRTIRPRSPESAPSSMPPPPPPPLEEKPQVQLSRPSTWLVAIPEKLSALIQSPPRGAGATTGAAGNKQQQQRSRGGGSGSPTKPAMEVSIPRDPNVSHISSLHADEYGNSPYNMGGHHHLALPAPPPPGAVGLTIDEDQFRVTGYSKLSNISTLAEQLETPAKIVTPIQHVRPHMQMQMHQQQYQPIVRGRNEEPLRAHMLETPEDFPRFRAGHLSHYEQRSKQHHYANHRGSSGKKNKANSSSRNSPRDLNESNTTHSSSLDSFGFPKNSSSGNKSVSTATLRAPPHSSKGIPRSNYSSMTTKLSNRRGVRSSPSQQQLPDVQDDHESHLSEDRLVPYYTKPPKPKPTLSSLGIGSTRQAPRSAADMQSVKSSKSFMSAGSFNFETLSTTQPSPTSTRLPPTTRSYGERPTRMMTAMEPETPQSEFNFMERPTGMSAAPISMTLASNAMQHSAFKPRKLAYTSSSSSPARKSKHENLRDWPS